MKFLARLVGLVLVAGGFIGLVVDGTRSIVNNALSFSSVREVVETLSSQAIPQAQVAATGLAPWLWDPILIALMRMPASVVGFVLGVFFLWLGHQRHVEPIGYLASR